MSRDFREVDRETAWLLPPSAQDWLPEDHPARFVVEIVDSLELGRLTSVLGHGGKRAYHPGMLLALLFYGYATGVFSSRKLEQATWDSVAFRYVAANSHPDHDTIAAFCKRFVGELGGSVCPDPDDGPIDGVLLCNISTVRANENAGLPGQGVQCGAPCR